MNSTGDKPECLRCIHFRNSPEFLESLYKGLTTLGSARGSVRCEDGICVLKGLYLAASQHCDRFEPWTGESRRALSQPLL
jgi:hypothetical protein